VLPQAPFATLRLLTTGEQAKRREWQQRQHCQLPTTHYPLFNHPINKISTLLSLAPD